MKLFRICTPVILFLSFVLCGCPVSSKFPLGLQTDAIAFDNNLVGTWENPSKEEEAKLIKIEKGSEKNTYKLKIVEKGDGFMADSDNFLCWVTVLNEKKFFVMQEILAPGENASFYVYQIAVSGNKLTSHNITLKVKGTDAITSVSSYREEVAASMEKEDFLTGKTVWTKK